MSRFTFWNALMGCLLRIPSAMPEMGCLWSWITSIVGLPGKMNCLWTRACDLGLTINKFLYSEHFLWEEVLLKNLVLTEDGLQYPQRIPATTPPPPPISVGKVWFSPWCPSQAYSSLKTRVKASAGKGTPIGKDARRKLWIKPLKDTNLGVAQPFLDPKKRPF